MILYEVYACVVPFQEYTATMRVIEIMQAVREEPYLRPTMPPDAPQWLHAMQSSLWHRDPTIRPPFYQCVKVINEFAAPRAKPRPPPRGK